MAVITLEIAAETNQPPNQPGVVSINLEYNELYVFTVADFTTLASPAYSDPEGDAFQNVKILTIPSQGVLTINGIAAAPDDIVTEAQIIAGLLEYQADPLDTDGYNENFTYTTSDVGSSTYSTFSGIVSIVVAEDIDNLPPTVVGDGSVTIDYGETLTFTRAMFTSSTTPAYSDPEGDEALFLKITSLPTLGEIQINGFPVSIDEVVDFADIDLGLLTYVPDLADTDGDLQGFTFEIADAGSGIFVE
jgi:hypothetical protein